MGAVVAFQDAENLTVEPGQTTTCQLSLANTGTIVEQFTIMFLGDVAPWTSAEPGVVSLFPGAQQTVTVTFAPPREHTVPAGLIHFAVKVIPSNEPDESVTEEGSITVGSFNDVSAELVPRVTTGRLRGRQKLAIDSRGNLPLPVEVSAADPSDALRFQIRPSKLTAAPGAAHFVRLRIRPRHRKWRGHPEQRPYQVVVSPEGEEPTVLPGGLEQKVIIPKWVMALGALILAAVLLWFLLIKPAVHSTAINANRAALAAQQKKTDALQSQLNAANAQNAANSAAIQKLTGKKPTPTTTTTTVKKPAATTTTTTKVSTSSTTGPPVTSNTDGNLDVVATPGSSASSSTGPIASGTTLKINDLVFQNVSGSTGTARVERLIPGQPVQVLLVENLGNLDDQEFTFDTPITFTHMQQLQLEVDCEGNQPACNVNMYYTGPITQPQSATTTTIP